LLFYQYDVELILTQGLKQQAPTVDQRDILFLELHGPLPGMMELAPYLRRWKEMAEIYETAFFSFSLLREPISYAVSYFNFFWTKPCTFRGCPYALYDPTIENLVSTSKPNIQCIYLAREVTWVAFTDNQTVIPEVSALECATVTEILLTVVDWVGTTEDISTVTLPLLAELIAEDGWEFAMNLPVHNKMSVTQDVIVTTDDLYKNGTAKQVEYLENIYKYDTNMYKAVQQVYKLDMWANFPNDALQKYIQDKKKHPEKYANAGFKSKDGNLGYGGRNAAARKEYTKVLPESTSAFTYSKGKKIPGSLQQRTKEAHEQRDARVAALRARNVDRAKAAAAKEGSAVDEQKPYEEDGAVIQAEEKEDENA
jgi:hypothetical protein